MRCAAGCCIKSVKKCIYCSLWESSLKTSFNGKFLNLFGDSGRANSNITTGISVRPYLADINYTCNFKIKVYDMDPNMSGRVYSV